MSRTTRDMSERGFALVGVVMFVLVLTILGLSLFSLTGYEAQFMQQSTDRAESFQAAAGGLDRARFALAKMQHLENVKDNLPMDGVVYAVARREANGDTTGLIRWSDPDYGNILIRVKAVKNGQTHFLEAKFNPSRAPSLYKRLFSLSATGMPDSSGLRVIRNDPAEAANQEGNYLGTYLYGQLKQNVDNNPDMIFPFGNPPQSTLSLASTGGVPAPEVSSFINDHWPAATEVTYPNGPKNFDLNALSAPDSVGFFRSSWTSGNWSFEFRLREQPGNNYNKFDPQVTVHGTAVWLFDKGIVSEGTFNVQGSGHSNDLLVLVANPSSDPGGFGLDGLGNSERSLMGAGIALLGSINSTIPVILVSNGGVLLEHRDFGLPPNTPPIQDDKKSSTVSCLSVFAPYARIMGPDTDMGDPSQPQRLRFFRNTTDAIDPRIDRLSDLGDLPNTAAGLKGKLRFLAGTWREVDETTPP
jgi:hypothetical protein